MGYCPYYQAIPESSELFRALDSDPRLADLLSQFFPLGCRPLDLREYLPDFEDTIDSLIGVGGYSTRADAVAEIERLESLIARACAEHPGLMDRTWMLDKTHHDIEDRLSELLRAEGREADIVLIQTLLLGESGVWPDSPFALTRPPAVRDGARVLQDFGPGRVFAGDERWEATLDTDYEPWRQVHLEAAERGEAVIRF